MNKKLLVISFLILSNNDAHARGFGGGFATGAILGTGVTLAATSRARHANRDPYYEVDRMKARQEAEEIRQETKLRREEDRRQRKLEKEEAREERKRARHNNHHHSNKKEISSNKERALEIHSLQLALKKLELEQAQAA